MRARANPPITRRLAGSTHQQLLLTLCLGCRAGLWGPPPAAARRQSQRAKPDRAADCSDSASAFQSEVASAALACPLCAVPINPTATSTRTVSSLFPRQTVFQTLPAAGLATPTCEQAFLLQSDLASLCLQIVPIRPIWRHPWEDQSGKCQPWPRRARKSGQALQSFGVSRHF